VCLRKWLLNEASFRAVVNGSPSASQDEVDDEGEEDKEEEGEEEEEKEEAQGGSDMSEEEGNEGEDEGEDEEEDDGEEEQQEQGVMEKPQKQDEPGTRRTRSRVSTEDRMEEAKERAQNAIAYAKESKILTGTKLGNRNCELQVKCLLRAGASFQAEGAMLQDSNFRPDDLALCPTLWWLNIGELHGAINVYKLEAALKKSNIACLFFEMKAGPDKKKIQKVLEDNRKKKYCREKM